MMSGKNVQIGEEAWQFEEEQRTFLTQESTYPWPLKGLTQVIHVTDEAKQKALIRAEA